MRDQHRFNFWLRLERPAYIIGIRHSAPFIAERDYLSTKLFGNGGEPFTEEPNRYGQHLISWR